MTPARNAAGRWIDLEAAAVLMDDELRERINDRVPEHGLDDPSAFLAVYAERHEEKYGEEFEPWCSGNW